MTSQEIETLVEKQRQYFQKGKTLEVPFRVKALHRLKASIEASEEEVYEALRKDLGKSRTESYMCEIGMVYSELNYMLKHIQKFAAKKRVRTPLAQAISHSYQLPVPKGNVLIMSPWNYPFLLTIDPLIDALAAGNTVLMKPSAYAPYTSAVLKKIVEDAFPEGLAAVIEGGRAENQALLEQKFNHIFFTGSQAVGKEVLKKAAEYLTPATLELGGKSPCIVEKSANIKMAARRIVFGKFVNCGQTCVAPDYIYCDKAISEKLRAAIVKELRKQYGKHPLANPDYGKIINKKHYDRLTAILDESNILEGGNRHEASLKIEPSILYPCTTEDKVMEDEIFGPLLPILEYDKLEDAIAFINDRSHPLACYIFSEDEKAIKKVMDQCRFGGGCINDTIIHLATSEMGFGGFQESGMGSYHGKIGFDTFTHYKSIVDKKTWLDLPMRYQPYTKLNDKLIHIFMK